MKVKLLIFLGLVLVGIHGMSASVDIPAMDRWSAALDEAIGAHQEYVAVREARIEALRQQLLQTDMEASEYFRLNGEMFQEYKHIYAIQPFFIWAAICAGRSATVNRKQWMKPASDGRT